METTIADNLGPGAHARCDQSILRHSREPPLAALLLRSLRQRSDAGSAEKQGPDRVLFATNRLRRIPTSCRRVTEHAGGGVALTSAFHFLVDDSNEAPVFHDFGRAMRNLPKGHHLRYPSDHTQGHQYCESS